MARKASVARGGSSGQGRITRDDLEAGFRRIGGEVDDEVAGARPMLVTVGVLLAVSLATAAYLLGRRRGRLRSTVVEIRRV